MQVRLLIWSLRHRRWRHVTNAIATAIMVAVVMLFVSVLLEVMSFARERTAGGLSRMLVTPKISAPGSNIDGMPMTFLDMFKGIEGAQVVQRRFSLIGRHPSGSTYFVIGEEDSGVELNADLYPVSREVVEAWKKDRPLGAIVTEATARDLRLKVGDTAEVPTAFGPLRIHVVAISRGSALTQLIGIHFDYIQQFTKNTDTSGYRIFTRPEDFDRVTAEVDALTKNSVMPTRAISSTEYRQHLARLSATIPTILGFLGLFLILTTALTLANSTAISVRERRTEAATLRVVGYHRGSILRLFVGEALIVGLVGGIVAIVVLTLLTGSGFKLGSAALSQPGLFQAVKMGWFAMACGIVTSIVVPLAGALPSAIAAVRTPLVEGLRDSG
jgi:ABC-type lipoprotein release transport system permease subunit